MSQKSSKSGTEQSSGDEPGAAGRTVNPSDDGKTAAGAELQKAAAKSPDTQKLNKDPSTTSGGDQRSADASRSKKTTVKSETKRKSDDQSPPSGSKRNNAGHDQRSDSLVEEELRQYVIFQLSKEEYGIPILQVRSIEKLTHIAKIPRIADFVVGVINLRGKLIPVIDLRKRFNVPPRSNVENRIIISRPIDEQVFGMLVDSVSEIQRIAPSAIEEVPPSITTVDHKHLTGVVAIDNRHIIVVDLESLLSEIEQAALAHITLEESADLDAENESEKPITEPSEIKE